MDGIAFAAIHALGVAPAVKRQKEGLVLLQMRGHIHFICIHGKVHQSTRFEAQKRCRRVSVFPVLLDSMLYILPRGWVFELDGGKRDTIER